MIKAVISSKQYEVLPEDVKNLYKFNSNGTYLLDLEPTGLFEHPNLAKIETAYKTKIDELENEKGSLASKIEEVTELNTGLIQEQNQKTVSETLKKQLNNYDLSEGRDQVIKRLLQPTIDRLLTDEGGDLNSKDVDKLIKRELDALRRTSPALLPDKMDDPTIEIGAKLEQPLKPNTPKNNNDDDGVDYDNFDGDIESIDYSHFMKHYINNEE